MREESAARALLAPVRGVGRATLEFVAEWGYFGALLGESLYWMVAGPFQGQPVRLRLVAAEAMTIGVGAIPVVCVLSFAIGVMLAIQGIHTLRTFGAESQVVLGIALSVTREFGSLITAIVVAGRSGSALAARIGTMQISQEVDALRVMAIEPVRFLVAPVLAAMLLVMPLLAFLAMLSGLLGGAVYSMLEMGLSPAAFFQRTIEILEGDDVGQGLVKSVVFAFIVALVGVSNGFSASGGAEGVGRVTTRAVVESIAYIVIADMIFTWYLNL